VLIDVIEEVFPTLINLIELIFLVIFVYALIGMQIFSTIKINHSVDNYPYY